MAGARAGAGAGAGLARRFGEDAPTPLAARGGEEEEEGEAEGGVEDGAGEGQVAGEGEEEDWVFQDEPAWLQQAASAITTPAGVRPPPEARGAPLTPGGTEAGAGAEAEAGALLLLCCCATEDEARRLRALATRTLTP